MKKILIATAVGLLVAGHVAAQEGPWLVRARAVHLQMVNDASSGLTALGPFQNWTSAISSTRTWQLN
jgi:outer membrane protein W